MINITNVVRMIICYCSVPEVRKLHAFKIYESVPERRLRNIVEENLGPWQHGFRRGKGTTDMTFVFRQLMEKHWEYDTPMLIIVYMDLVIREVATTQEHHNYIRVYADDIAQTAASEGELADIMNVWQAAFNKYYLKLNLLKTEVMMMERSHHTINIKIGDYTLKQVQSFRHLGSTVNEQSTQEEDIKKWIAKYSQIVGCMYRLLKDRNVPKKAKEIIHETILIPILIFGSECWTFTKRLEQQITTANMKVIRIIQGVTRWDRTINEDLYKQSNMLPIVQVINKNKLRWFGHVMKKEEEPTLRVVMKLKRKGNIPRGRPRLRYLDNIDSHLKGKRPRGRPRLRWLDNIDSHLKGKNTSLKEVLETKCFENRKDWRTLMSNSTDMSFVEDP